MKYFAPTNIHYYPKGPMIDMKNQLNASEIIQRLQSLHMHNDFETLQRKNYLKVKYPAFRYQESSLCFNISIWCLYGGSFE